jgi:hypothetical protein
MDSTLNGFPPLAFHLDWISAFNWFSRSTDFLLKNYKRVERSKHLCYLNGKIHLNGFPP